jgi:hypothetical protein
MQIVLHLTGPAQIKVSLYDGQTKIVPAPVVNFEISTRDDSRRFRVRRGYSIDELEVKRNQEWQKKRWKRGLIYEASSFSQLALTKSPF